MSSYREDIKAIGKILGVQLTEDTRGTFNCSAPVEIAAIVNANSNVEWQDITDPLFGYNDGEYVEYIVIKVYDAEYDYWSEYMCGYDTKKQLLYVS